MFSKGNRPNLCMSDKLIGELIENNVTEFANFAYTDYGSLFGGDLDYSAIRFVRENYKKNEGCAIESTGWGGSNMILYGEALGWFFNKLCINKDTVEELYYGLEDAMCDYEWEGACEDARDLIEHDEDFKGFNEALLASIINENNSGYSYTNRPDYSVSQVLEDYKKWVA